MAETFFIGDMHFGHRNIINFDSTKAFRPFGSILEHDAELINRWNSVVRTCDDVWVLGDFCFGKKNIALAGLLNGTKRLVMGNHDMYPSADYLKYFKRLSGAVEWNGFIMTHIPVSSYQFARYRGNIHGHLHNEIIPCESRYINVSCEQINLTPMSSDELLLLWKERGLQ